MPPTERDRARGHQDDFLSTLAQVRDIRGEAFQPRAVQTAFVGIDEKRRTHFDDHSLGLDQAPSRDFAVGNIHLDTICHLLSRGASPNIRYTLRSDAATLKEGRPHVGREYEPTVGQWYEDLENEETFQV